MTAPQSDIFDNQARFKLAVEGFAPSRIVQMVIAHSAITGLAMALGWLLPAAVPGHGGEYLGPWLLVALQAPLAVTAARLFIRRERMAFWRLHNALGVANFVWLGLLMWAAPSFYSALLLVLFATWAYYDAWITAGRDVGRLYLLAAPVVDLALLLIDAAGGRGLIWAWRAEQGPVLAFLSLQVVLTAMFQMLIRWVGDQAADADRRLLEQAQHETELALMRREREVIQASASVLTTGLMASKFSHDLATPTTVLRLDAEELKRLVATLPDSPTRVALAEIAVELGDVARQVGEMTGGVARAVREREPLTTLQVGALVDEAVAAMSTTLHAHQAGTPQIQRSLAEEGVWVTSGHASTLGNLLVNAALHAPARPISVEGGPVNPWFYRLTVRDFGSEGAERDEALARIRRLLALDAEGTPRAASYRGYGVGLALARLFVVRYNGWLAPRQPASGAGIAFDVVLPRVDPSCIPGEENRPEECVLHSSTEGRDHVA